MTPDAISAEIQAARTSRDRLQALRRRAIQGSRVRRVLDFAHAKAAESVAYLEEVGRLIAQEAELRRAGHAP